MNCRVLTITLVKQLIFIHLKNGHRCAVGGALMRLLAGRWMAGVGVVVDADAGQLLCRLTEKRRQ